MKEETRHSLLRARWGVIGFIIPLELSFVSNSPYGLQLSVGQ